MDSEATKGWSDLIALSEQANDVGYANFVSRFHLEWYRERLARIGFANFEHVLDVGCGYGQWSLALAERNEQVTALELNKPRLAIARDLAAGRGVANIDFAHGSGTELPFTDGSFDALFCYGVFMFMDPKAAISEFHRVLRPGGRVYVCTNGQGWWLRMLLDYFFKNPSLRASGWRGFVGGRNGASPNATQRRDVPRLLPATQWSDVVADLEGCIAKVPGTTPLSAYEGTYCGFDAVIEFTATRGTLEERKAYAAQKLADTVEATIASDHVDFLGMLDEFPQPRPVTDLVNNCSTAKVHTALRGALLLPRTQILRELFERLARDSKTPQEKALACITFAQKHFYHHFAGQPMKCHNEMVLDPVAALLLRIGRCGTVARFLVDLFTSNGMPARLITGACHTSAEVEVDGVWRLAEASLFPSGIVPRDENGAWIGIEQIAIDPSLLDRCPSYINYNARHIDRFLAEYPETDEPIGKYLRAPLLPSVGFFGAEFFAAREAGVCERFRKASILEEWDADPDFGWGSLKVEDRLAGPVVATRQRPGQPQGLRQDGNLLSWSAGAGPVPKIDVRYEVCISEKSRNWSYDNLPTDCTFEVPGRRIDCGETKIPLDKLKGMGRFVSIIAKIPAWTNEKIFYLPSDEIELVMQPG